MSLGLSSLQMRSTCSNQVTEVVIETYHRKVPSLINLFFTFTTCDQISFSPDILC